MTELNPQDPLPPTPSPGQEDTSSTPPAPTHSRADVADHAAAKGAADDENYTAQVRTLKMGELEILGRGGDPVKEMTPGQAGTDTRAQLEYIAGQQSKRYLEIRTAADTAGWGDLYGFMKEVTDQYRAENNAPLQKLHEFSSPEDQFRLQMQLRPIEVDPNRVAEMRQLAVQIDTAIKAVDPEASFWTHPDFKSVADWLNRKRHRAKARMAVATPIHRSRFHRIQPPNPRS